MSNDKKTGEVLSFLAGAVLGGAIGAGVALLFAPRSGEETRKIIKDKADDLGKEFEDWKKEVGPKIEKAKKDISKKLQPKKK